MNISLFQNTWTTEPEKIITVSQALKAIKSDRYKDQVELIRKLKNDGDPNYKEEKKKLPAVTFSGTFTKRLASNIIDYNSVLCVDIDSLDSSALPELRTKLAADKYCLGLFDSPSGDGLKFLLYCPECDSNNHQLFYFTAERYFKDTYGIDIDRACKDVSRLCYLSWDPNAFVASSVTTFPVDFNIKPEGFFIRNTYSSTGGVESLNPNTERCFKMAVRFTERIFIFEEGQRNKYIHNLSCTLNRLGVPLENAIALIDQNYITPDKKWIQSVGSAYKHNASEFNSVKLKDFNPGVSEPIPYVEKEFKFGDVERDIRRIIKRMLEKSFPIDVLKPMAETYCLVYRNFFDQDIIDTEGLPAVVDYLISAASDEFKSNELATLNPITASSIYDMGMGIKASLNTPSDFTLGIEGADDLYPGLFCRGNMIEFIGRDKTFKSVTAQIMAYKNACAGRPGIYCNGEMSGGQFIKRAVKIDSGVDFDHYLSRLEKIPNDIYDKSMRDLDDKIKKNLHIHTGKNFTIQGIADLITKLRSEGLDIGWVVVDGLTQVHDSKNDEIQSAIYNSMELKELAKNSNVLVVPLIHMSSGVDKTIRDCGEYVRGGNKVTANADAYFAFSLFEIPGQDPAASRDKSYYPSVFHLLLNDKRGALDVIRKVVEVDKQLKPKISEKEPKDYQL